MNSILKFISAGLLVASTVSCNLDLYPKGSVNWTPGQELITNEADLEALEANVMYCFRALEYGSYDIVPDVMVDYFNAASDFGNHYGPVHRLDDSFTPSDSDIETNWANPYAAIKNFNLFIESADKVTGELKEMTDIVKGEALLGRAFAYLHLARHFGLVYNPETADTDLCVPLVTEYNQVERPSRATVAQVYGQIKKDLDAAAELLARVPGQIRAQYPTIDAVNFMYARYYLDTKNYSEAATYAMSVINSAAGYSLSSTAGEMASEWSNDSGNEPVMQFYASASEGVGSHVVYLGENGMSNDPIKGLYYRPKFIPTAKLVNSYPQTDLRFRQWFDNSYPSYHNSVWYNDGVKQYYVFSKYPGNSNLNPSSSVPNSGHAIKPFLIGEMYLIAAEAYFMDGNTPSAKTVLNKLQTARGGMVSSDVTMEEIQDEWYREVVGEGLYFSCLKRWSKGFDGRAAQNGAPVMTQNDSYALKVLKADDYHFNWPIPTYEMQTNVNLENQQNEGYSSSVEG